MKAKRILLLLLGAMTFLPRPSAAEGNGLRIDISLPKEEYVVGEEVVLHETWRNEGTEAISVAYGVGGGQSPSLQAVLTGPVRSECVAAVKTFKLTPCAHRTIAPGEVIQHAVAVSSLGAVDMGIYEVQRVYDATALPLSCGDTPWFNGRIESNRVRFSIRAAQGVDQKAMEKYGRGGCNLVVMTEEALKEFPTSTYTAYALLNAGRPGYSWPGKQPPSAADEFRKIDRMLERCMSGPHVRPQELPTYRRYHEADMKKEAVAIDYLERLKRDFPDFVYRADALYALLRAYFRVGDAEKAITVIDEVLDKHAGSELAERTVPYKKVLVDNKLWPIDKPHP